MTEFLRLAKISGMDRWRSALEELSNVVTNPSVLLGLVAGTRLACHQFSPPDGIIDRNELLASAPVGSKDQRTVLPCLPPPCGLFE